MDTTKEEGPIAETFFLVRTLDCRWNHFEPSLYLLYNKLVSFGVVLVDDEVHYPEGEEVSNA